MNRFVLEDEDIIILGEKETIDDTSNTLDSDSASGGVSIDKYNEQTPKNINGKGKGWWADSENPHVPGSQGGMITERDRFQGIDGIDYDHQLMLDDTPKQVKDLSTLEYYKQIKDREVRILDIKPSDYLELLQRAGHSEKITHESLRDSDTLKYFEDMKKGDKFSLPFISLGVEGRVLGQEGRHRAEAASLKGIKKMPLILEYSASKGLPDGYLDNISFEDRTKDYKRAITKAHKD